MHTTKQIGPFPCIDPSVSKITDATNPVVTTLGSNLNVRLDTANLGTKSEAFTNVLNTGSTSVATREGVSYGVCLQPLENFMNKTSLPIFVELSYSYIFEYSNAFDITPFVGFIDSASAILANGWDATHNIVTDYANITGGGGDANHIPGGNYNNGGGTIQMLLKDINSGGLDIDKFLCLGFTARNTSTGASTLTDIEYLINARYSYKPEQVYMES